MVNLREKINILNKNQGFMRYFTNVSWIFTEKILRIISSLFIGIWVARYLGPEQFGLFSYAKSFVGLFTVLATLGLNGIVVRELVRGNSHAGVLMGTAFWLKFMGAFGVMIVLAIAVNFTSNDTFTNTLVFIVASGTIFQSFNVIDFYFQSKVLIKYVVFANIISLFISSILKIVLILINASLIAFAWVVLFDSIILACGFAYFFYKNNSTLSIPDFAFKKETAVTLLKDSWPLILSGMVIAIYMRIDQTMIKEMIDAEAVGQYAAAVGISEAWYFIPIAISTSLYPAIVNAKKKSNTLYYERLQKLYDLMVWMAIAIALPMTFMSEWIIELLYGEQYSQAASVLTIHIWAGVFVFLGVASSKWFVTENLQKYSFYRTMAGAIVNILLNYILIPLYSIYGAAIATLISQAVASYLFNVTNIKLRHTFKLQTNTILLPLRKLGVKFG
jgi:O-antigen/teichoic acid export membrane protein